MGLVHGLLTVSLLLSAANQPMPMPKVVIADQFERPRQMASERGDVIILIYGDKASANANQSLGTQLHVAFHPSAKGQSAAKAATAPVTVPANWPAQVPVPEVRVLAIASIGKVPNVVVNVIRGQFRKGSPDVPVYLDFEDRLKQLFGLSAGVTNVVIVDTNGMVRATMHGTFTQEKTTEAIRLIEQLRQEARPQN
jgi:hypothetical protein